MTARWSNSPAPRRPRSAGRHRRGPMRLLGLAVTPQVLAGRWRKAHGDITSSPAPYRHLDRAGTAERDAAVRTQLDTALIPLASAFVPVASTR